MHVSHFSPHSIPSQPCYKNTSSGQPLTSKGMPPSTDIELKIERTEYSYESKSKLVGENSIHISEASVQYTYERISFDSPNLAANSAVINSDFDVDAINRARSVDNDATNDAAKTILAFIENRIEKDIAEGASPEEVESRLQAGLEGFKKGFAEAKEQLDALGLLTENEVSGGNGLVKDKIDQTYSGVIAGIEDLRNRYIGEELAEKLTHDSVQASSEELKPKEIAVTDNSRNSPVIDRFQNRDVFKGANESYSKISSFHQTSNVSEKQIDTDISLMESFTSTSRLANAESATGVIHRKEGIHNRFSFQVETADGDKVTITAKTVEASASEYNQVDQLLGQHQNLSRYSEQDSHFSIDINGELDENELNAIGVLLNKVENLSINFFEGDLDLAFNKAKTLGYDTNEIVGFSLNLKHTEIEKVRATYQEFLPKGDNSNVQPKSLLEQLQPIGVFAKDLMDAAQIASSFNDSYFLILEMAANVERQQQEHNSFENRFTSFVKDVLEADDFFKDQ